MFEFLRIPWGFLGSQTDSNLISNSDPFAPRPVPSSSPSFRSWLKRETGDVDLARHAPDAWAGLCIHRPAQEVREDSAGANPQKEFGAVSGKSAEGWAVALGGLNLASAPLIGDVWVEWVRLACSELGGRS